MSKFKFTNTSLKKATADLDKDGVKNVTLRDTELRGFACRRQRQDWVFIMERKIRGKVRRVSIETYDSQKTNVAAVRQSANSVLVELIEGTYESRKASDDQTDDLSRMTITDVIDLHERVNPQLRPNTFRSYRFAVNYLTEGRALRMADLTTDYVRKAYGRLLESHSAATANQMLRTVKALWNTWAEEHPDDKAPTRNPVSSITGKKKGRMQKSNVREGALSPAQRKPWHNAVMTEVKRRGPTATGYAALAMMFLTGLRAQEVLGLSWDEVDDTALTISPERMKAGEALTKPITPAVRQLLDHQRTFHPDSPWVFPARVGDGHMQDVRKALWPVNEQVGVSITPHDLRRTWVATAELSGVPQVAIKMLVGHTTSDVTDDYARAIRSELGHLAEEVEEKLLS